LRSCWGKKSRTKTLPVWQRWKKKKGRHLNQLFLDFILREKKKSSGPLSWEGGANQCHLREKRRDGTTAKRKEKERGRFLLTSFASKKGKGRLCQ